MMKRLFGVLLATLVAVAGCSSSGKATAEKPGSGGLSPQITVGLTYVPDIQFAPFYVAEKKGLFTKHKLTVKLRHHGAQEGIISALSNGSEDVLFAGGDEMMEARSNRVDVVNWATMYQKYPVTLLVPEDSPIKTTKDIEGHTIGLPQPYGENHYTMEAMLNQKGIDRSKVKVQYIGYTQAAALASHKVDGIVGFRNSDAVAAQRQGVKVRTVDLPQGELPLVGVGLGSLSSNLEKNKEYYVRMLEALKEAVEWAKKNPEESVKIASEYVPALKEADNAKYARTILENTLELYAGSRTFGSQETERWNAMAQFMSAHLLKKPVEADKAFVDLTTPRK